MFAKQMADHLKEKILPFWMNLKDDDFGGFYGLVKEDLTLKKDAMKGCILNSRILWTFSTAARICKNDAYLPYAKQAFDFMKKFMDEERGGVYWSVTFDGKPIDTTKHTYCQAFAVYGLAAYYRATSEQEALDRAMALYRVIEDKCRDEGGYGEAFRYDFGPESNEKLSENGVMASRTMNTLLHVLEAYAELYRACGDDEVKKAAQDALSCFLNVMYNKDLRRLEVFYDADFNSMIDLQSYGHDVEASWLMWDAVEAVIDEEERAPYREMCLDLLNSVLERAMTEEGFHNECEKGIVDVKRVWWVQAEAVLGFENAWKLTGDAKYKENIEKVWQYIQKVTIDKREGGEWYAYTTVEGKPLGKPMVDEWKCPYHNGRMCLRVMERNL
ncbi:MAG: AGE family epimerase/isomerase [Clostridia bacterium]|nr:AGE family epimerase/isomerase [Clostridia bacterium]